MNYPHNPEPKVEAITQPQFRSGEMRYRFDEIISGLPQTGGSSFTALLELPPTQAVELLVKEDFPVKLPPPPIFPSDIGLIDRASKFSVFALADNSLESNKILPASSSVKPDVMKEEPLDSNSNPNSSSPAVSNKSPKSGKRKGREKNAKDSNKKSKKVATNDDGDEKLPYVHVRARRGQATDSHSLAERARREKINARMKLLQELVPGCDKISGTAMVLDEIINHVQALQQHVEFLSMRLAAVNPRIDFNIDALLAGDNGMFTTPPPVWSEGQTNGNRHIIDEPIWGRGEDDYNMHLSFDSPANSASLHLNQLKMEL